ncbi:hypothetical protein Q5P01_005355 [Channa striata]|uniref:Uncharacterized protein n=1 Tax=Channa striata TaxID=64152 RepID=A0AA88NNM5_CHASR|nr:hypothetical protein Q5P01_005355 [Channa striata]
MAVRYDRRYILGLILQQTHRVRSTPSYTDRAGCFHTEDGRTPLHLACELLRPEAVVMLLGNGASPHAQDLSGLTPLDVVLEKLRDSKDVNGGERRQCLDNLLMFMPKVHFKMQEALGREPELWAEVLGEETYKFLVGRSPAPLVLTAMQTVLKQLSPATFPECLHELPIPSSLKPPGLPESQRHKQSWCRITVTGCMFLSQHVEFVCCVCVCVCVEPSDFKGNTSLQVCTNKPRQGTSDRISSTDLTLFPPFGL